MSYDSDAYAWAYDQAALLRRMWGERVNDLLDWPNIIEEIEAVGRSELRVATSPLIRAMQHKLYLLGWPVHLSARHWQAEIGDPRIRVGRQSCRSSELSRRAGQRGA